MSWLIYGFAIIAASDLTFLGVVVLLSVLFFLLNLMQSGLDLVARQLVGLAAGASKAVAPIVARLAWSWVFPSSSGSFSLVP
ncbi:hypothetical protein Nepgr_027231 [Nepenthes gracilis]|uniref:Uncharacterized protein n=1 Tax=Nepenthes gracilis TaxID=150966 RepID=A0AAD3TA03_NEPGR|nr:hypothetical protein Nepgr_027231 [Nepenthes gracilis]